MKRNMIKKSKGFTLIELLIVIGILAVLAVTLLLALNPAEAQKRARDTKRLRDAATLQAIINQYLESGLAFTNTALTSGTGTNSLVVVGTGNAPQPCSPTSSNWLGINVCPYAQTVPVDPNNGQLRTFQGNATPVTAQYWARVDGSDYEIDVRLEAQANAAMITTDTSVTVGNGNGVNRYEVFSGSPTVLP